MVEEKNGSPREESGQEPIVTPEPGADLGGGQVTDFIAELVKNKGEKFKDPKEVAKAYIELEKLTGEKANKYSDMENDIAQLYGFYQNVNPHLDIVKKHLAKSDPVKFVQLWGEEELKDMNVEKNDGGDITPEPTQIAANQLLEAFKKDPRGVREILTSILGPVLSPMQRNARNLSTKNALDAMEKDKDNFPYFSDVVKAMKNVLDKLPDHQVPRNIEQYKTLYDAAVGQNIKEILKGSEKDITKKIYQNIVDKGFEIEEDMGALGDGFGGSEDKEVREVLNAKLGKI